MAWQALVWACRRAVFREISILAWRMVTNRARRLLRNRESGHASGLRVQARSDSVACPRLSWPSRRDTPMVRLVLCFIIVSPYCSDRVAAISSRLKPQIGQQVVDLILARYHIDLALRTDFRPVQQRICFLAFFLRNVVDQDLHQLGFDGRRSEE